MTTPVPALGPTKGTAGVSSEAVGSNTFLSLKAMYSMPVNQSLRETSSWLRVTAEAAAEREKSAKEA